jgi:hypothetical protein
MRLIECPRCGEETEVRDMVARQFLTPGPDLQADENGWTQGVVCQCGQYLAYGHLEGGQFVIERETL